MTQTSLFLKRTEIYSRYVTWQQERSPLTHHLTDYINWVEENLPGRSLSDVTWEEIRSYKIPVIHNGLCDTRHRQWPLSKESL